MMINTNALIPMTDANQNFSKVVRLVDEQGTAVILKIISPDMLLLTFLNMMIYWSIEKNMIEKTADTG